MFVMCQKIASRNCYTPVSLAIASSRSRAPKSVGLQLFRGLATASLIKVPRQRVRNSQARTLSSTPLRSASASSSTENSSPISSSIVYDGPLSRTFRSLKIFSLSSLGLATALTPFMFIIDTSLPYVARVVLASTAMLTSGISTMLVGWCGQPYVSTIRTLGASSPTSEAGSTKSSDSEKAEGRIEGIQIETRTLTLRPRFTTVYDSSFLADTRRPFAKWELAENVLLQKPSTSENETTGAPSEETVAETMDAEGRILGRWIVSWSDDGLKGTCRGEGKVQRHFNVHEELLPPNIR